ncbi:unnamed protein product, partial [marine sediment metagenome]
MVMNGFLTTRSLVNSIVPATSKIHTLGLDALIHANNEPNPEAFRLITLYIVVWGISKCLPLPATVDIPKPKAPGIIGRAELLGVFVGVGETGVSVGGTGVFVITGVSVAHPTGQTSRGVGVGVGEGRIQA